MLTESSTAPFTITSPEFPQSSGLPPIMPSAFPPGAAPFYHHGGGPRPTEVEEGDQANDHRR